MGLNWGCPPNSSRASAAPSSLHVLHAPLPIASSVRLSHPQCRSHRLPTSLNKCAVSQRAADRRLSRLVRLPGIGCRKPQPISTWPWTPEVWQIEYPRSVSARSETPPNGNRLQRTAALKEIGRPVYF